MKKISKIFAVFLNLFMFLGILGQTSAMSWTQQTNSGSRDWTSIASSSDGSKLAATATSNGYIYTSTDGGLNWTERTGAGSRSWNNIISSSDGTKLVATTDGHVNYIYTSNDSGDTWTEQTNLVVYNLYDVAMSSNGTKLIAASSGYAKYIYTSTDSGVTWVNRPNLTGNILDVAYSSDGTKAVSTDYGGYINTSTDGGTNWTERTSAGQRNWMAVSMSSDGTKIIAAVQNGYIYTSDDSGATWTEITSVGSRVWYSVSMSNDGTKMIAGPSDNYPYISTDSGSTWSQETGAGSRTWYDVVTSGNGAKFAAVVSGYVYTGVVAAPSIAMVGDTNTTDTSVTLAGNITDTNGANPTVRGFQYGPTTDYGTTTIENGDFSTGDYTANITDLISCTTYHYRAYATNSAGSGYSTDNTFTTFCSPAVTTGTPKFLNSTSERLKGNITNTGGENATVRGFQYGPTTDYGTTTTDSGDHSTGAFSADVTGLNNGAAYHYRSYATNSVGTSYGSDQTFVVGATSTISTCAEFESINTDVDTLDGVYSLSNDLDCTSEGNYIMVAADNPFTGTFNGNDHTMTVSISNVVGSPAGLFSQISSASISSLNIAGSISGADSVGALAGYVDHYGSGPELVSNISNIHSTATVSGSSSRVGGLIGYIYAEGNGMVDDATYFNIANSSSSGSVSGGSNSVGGLIGYFYTNMTANVNITNSYATGNVSGDGGSTGGLIGYFEQYDGGITTISGNHYSGNISDSSSDVGGLIGSLVIQPSSSYDDLTFNITNNYTSGSIDSDSENVGGLIGYLSGDNYQENSLDINITNNYSTSNIDANQNSYVGGLVGIVYLYNDYTDYNLNLNFSKNYYEGNIIDARGSSGGLFGYVEISNNPISFNVSESYFSGTLDSSSGGEVGGLIGYYQNDSDLAGTISNSYFSGQINNADSNVGGLIGTVSSSSADLEITNSYAKGSFTSSNPLISGKVGGLIGLNGHVNTSITNSFASVVISDFATEYGAVVGSQNGDTLLFNNVYFDQTISGGIGCLNNDSASSCTSVNTVSSPNTTYFQNNKTNAPFNIWNFDTVWCQTSTYPTLRAVTSCEALVTPTPTVSSGGSFPVYILQAMSDAIHAKENQINNLNNNINNTNNGTSNKFIFLKNLKYKDRNTDVKELQKFLNTNNFKISRFGVGSIGNETNYFGVATRSALIKYQLANKIKPAVGYFGPVTRGVVNK